MMLYHYTGFEYALDDILHHHIKVATLDAANDPNEWLFSLKKPDGTYYPIEWIKQWLLKEYSHRYGFVSFSESITNPVMWSHYAEKHNGIALGFDLSSAAKNLIKVDYLRKRVKFLETEICNPIMERFEGLSRKQISQKHVDWRYEKEWRFYVELPGICTNRLCHGKLIYLYPIKEPIHLKEVVIGCDARERLNEVKNALHFEGWEDVVINQAHFSQTTFEMEIRPAEEKVAEGKT